MTSPPYWGLRDYGTGSWVGGNPDCDHLQSNRYSASTTLNAKVDDPASEAKRTPFRDVCGKCGARRVDQQLGLEPTPEAYVQRMVEVFREVRRVLRSDGTCWVNLGDSYNANQGAGFNGQKRQDHANRHTVMERPDWLKPKDLCGIPWRTAFALQADGWYLRSDIIWSKPNPMPESVTDRPTKAHEYVFLLSKSPRYFFDQEAVREANSPGSVERFGITENGQSRKWNTENNKRDGRTDGTKSTEGFRDHVPVGRNVRSVWEIATQPYPEAHFATYPEELVRRCVLAGSSERGCCPVCGKPWEREVAPTEEYAKVQAEARKGTKSPKFLRETDGLSRAPLDQRGHFSAQYVTLGWRPGCDCPCPVCLLPYVNDPDMRPLRAGLHEETQSPEVLQPSLREPGGSGETAEADQDDEGIHRPAHAGSSVRVEAGLRDGAPGQDGGEAGAFALVAGSGASQERPEGRQSASESRSDAEAAARSEAEETAAPDSVPALRSADSGSESALRGCRCGTERPVVACVVLDPFLGSGTTAYVARRHGRRSIGIELNPAYADLAAKRMAQQSLEFAA